MSLASHALGNVYYMVEGRSGVLARIPARLTGYFAIVRQVAVPVGARYLPEMLRRTAIACCSQQPPSPLSGTIREAKDYRMDRRVGIEDELRDF